MASNVFVIDASARRQQIKVQPGTHLRSVLEEACAKLSLDADQYTLKTDRDKELDLSLTFRLSGLSPGAKLSLTQASRTPAVVNVALTVPSENNLRLQDKFPSNTPIWLVLRKFEEGVAGGDSAQKLNFTSRGAPSKDSAAGRVNYEQPCVNAVGRNLSCFTDLQKTLAQLGMNKGSVMLRLTFKQDDTAMEEAMAQISSYFQAIQPPPSEQTSAQSATSAANTDSSAENTAAPMEGLAGSASLEDTVKTTAPSADEKPVSSDDVMASSPISAVPPPQNQFPSLEQHRPASSSAPQPKFSVYSAPTGNTPQAAQQAYNESDFAPSVEHAHAHQAVLNRQSQNKRLQSDKEIEAAASTKKQALAHIKSAMIRVRFPDQMMVDFSIIDTDTVKGLYTGIRDMLQAPNQAFELRAVGAKKGLETMDPSSEDRLIADVGMTGRVLVTVVWSSSVDAVARQQPVLKEELRAEAKKLEVQMPKEQEDVVEEAKVEKKQAPKKKSGASNADIEAKMKKMLGFGRK